MAELWSVWSEWSEIPPLDAPTNGWWALSGQWSSEEKFPRSSTARGSRQWAVAVLTAAIPLLWVHCPPAAHIGQPVWSEVENSLGLPAHIGQLPVESVVSGENPQSTGGSVSDQ